MRVTRLALFYLRRTTCTYYICFMFPLQFTPFPVLQEGPVVLRQMSLADTPSIYQLRSRPELSKYIYRNLCKQESEAAQFIESINAAIQRNESLYWAITLPANNFTIGTFCLWNISEVNKRAEIGYELLTEYHGKGYMQHSAKAVIDYAFNTLGLHSLEAVVNPGNAPSIKVLERNHFKREALFTENEYHDGRFTDTAIYSLLATWWHDAKK